MILHLKQALKSNPSSTEEERKRRRKRREKEEEEGEGGGRRRRRKRKEEEEIKENIYTFSEKFIQTRILLFPCSLRNWICFITFTNLLKLMGRVNILPALCLAGRHFPFIYFGAKG
jgi:hypothetical protein